MNSARNVSVALLLLLEAGQGAGQEAPPAAEHLPAAGEGGDEDAAGGAGGAGCAARGPRHRVYYYTRPTLEPVAYGENLLDYRRAHGLRWPLCATAPERLAKACIWGLVRILRGLSGWLRCPVADSLAYLLHVSQVQHTFDNSRFRQEFPAIGALEESTLECFARIRERRQG